MLFPAISARMIDVWQVIGLRGTASDSYTVTDLFVPREYSIARDDQAERRQPGALYCFPSATSSRPASPASRSRWRAHRSAPSSPSRATRLRAV